MKKLMLLALTLCFLTACTDNDQDLKDPFIGIWYKFSLQGKEVSDCEKKTTFIVKEDKSISIASFEFYENKCVDDGTATGVWSKHGDTTYGITIQGDTKPSLRKLTFSNNNNSFRFTDKEHGKEFTYVYKRK